MHLARADLHLERLALRPDHRGVQRPVVVRLRLGDVVVELARQRRPQLVDDAEHRVAIAHVVDEHAHRADVVERLDAAALAAHLAPDAEDVLRPAADLGVDAHGAKLALERGDHLVDVALAVEPPAVEELRDLLVGLRLGGAQREVLELPLQLPDAEPVRERRVEVEHLASGVAAQDLVARHRRAQGREPLRQLDDHDADVLDHREQHLAQVLRLRRALGRGDVRRLRADRRHALDARRERRPARRRSARRPPPRRRRARPGAPPATRRGWSRDRASIPRRSPRWRSRVRECAPPSGSGASFAAT